MSLQRILLGTMEICNQVYTWGEALKSMGYEVHTVVGGANPYFPESTYSEFSDRDANARLLGDLQASPVAAWATQHEALTQLHRLMTGYDVYIFQWGCSLVGRLQELELLRALGKTVICVFNGSDLRSAAAYELHNQKCNMPAAPFAIQENDPCGSMNVKMGILRRAELYAHVRTGSPDYMSMAMRPYYQCYVPMRVAGMPHAILDRDVPVLIHAPSRRDFKGTSLIVQALEDLKAEGLQFEFRLLEGVSNKVVLENLADADIAVDQLYADQPGTFAMEALATGCAVAGGNRSDIAPYPADRPIQHIDPTSVKEGLRRLISERSYRLELAQRGRVHVMKHHDPAVSIARILDAVERSKQGDFDYVPELFTNEFQAPDNEPVSDENRQLNRAVAEQCGLSVEQMESLQSRGLA